MAEPSPSDRIDAALARIEQAVATRERVAAELKQRHDTLRGKVGDAIAALDALGAARG